MQQKFRILRIVAVIWKVLAWLVLVVSILGGCGTLAMGLLASGSAAAANSRDMLGIGLGGILGGGVTALIAIFFGVLYFVFLYAFAELVDVMIALEENTRATAEQLKSMASKT